MEVAGPSLTCRSWFRQHRQGQGQGQGRGRGRAGGPGARAHRRELQAGEARSERGPSPGAAAASGESRSPGSGGGAGAFRAEAPAAPPRPPAPDLLKGPCRLLLLTPDPDSRDRPGRTPEIWDKVPGEPRALSSDSGPLRPPLGKGRAELAPPLLSLPPLLAGVGGGSSYQAQEEGQMLPAHGQFGAFCL